MYERLSAIEVVFYSSFKVVTYLNAITHNFPQYTMDIVKFWDTLQPFFVVGVVLVGLIAAWRVRCWSNRNTRPDSSRPLNLQYVTIDWKFLSHVVFFFTHIRACHVSVHVRHLWLLVRFLQTPRQCIPSSTFLSLWKV